MVELTDTDRETLEEMFDAVFERDESHSPLDVADGLIRVVATNTAEPTRAFPNPPVSLVYIRVSGDYLDTHVSTERQQEAATLNDFGEPLASFGQEVMRVLAPFDAAEWSDDEAAIDWHQ